MLEVQLGFARRPRSKYAVNINPGTVFLGRFYKDLPIFSYLQTDKGSLNLTSFTIIDKEIVYDYSEITDAILTRTSVCSLFSDVSPVSDSSSSLREAREKLEFEETKRARD